STGMSTKEEVDTAVEYVSNMVTGSSLFHCHSAYPAPDCELNLRVIHSMQGDYDLPIGYSSHSVSPYPAIYAGVMGAKAVEVHITLDRTMEGSDHRASLEKKGLELLRRELDRIPLVMGDGEKRVWDSEVPARKKLRG
ncbi:MAG TPA: N-acetylneuraminate synthase family protein, partial [Candidatus Hodarchaeales archaeon]|nr:N-acetylneuraminate synthase family protein [Candidatus Hodarchaeales archaeon]